MNQETNLALIILAVDDVRTAVAFYRKAFAWEQVVDEPVYAEFVTSNLIRVGLYQRDAFAKTAGGRFTARPDGELSGAELYLYVDEVTPAAERLQEAGAELTSSLELRHWGDEACYFVDPFGTVIVLARDNRPQ